MGLWLYSTSMTIRSAEECYASNTVQLKISNCNLVVSHVLYFGINEKNAYICIARCRAYIRYILYFVATISMDVPGNSIRLMIINHTNAGNIQVYPYLQSGCSDARMVLLRIPTWGVGIVMWYDLVTLTQCPLMKPNFGTALFLLSDGNNPLHGPLLTPHQ